jgi:hypothetical protein
MDLLEFFSATAAGRTQSLTLRSKRRSHQRFAADAMRPADYVVVRADRSSPSKMTDPQLEVGCCAARRRWAMAHDRRSKEDTGSFR